MKIESGKGITTNDFPLRIPSFAKIEYLNGHEFEIDGNTYEYYKGRYFKKCHILEKGESIGEIALQRKCLRTASIRAEQDCVFATLSKAEYDDSIAKITYCVEQEAIDFLKKIPCFNPFSSKTVLGLYLGLKFCEYHF